MITKIFSFGVFLLGSALSFPSFGDPGWVRVPQDNTIVKIKDNFGHCTGTRISNEGHILTARHCFNACLISRDFVSRSMLYPDYGWQSPVLFTFPNENKAICPVELDGVMQDLEVLFASRGFMTPMDQSSLSMMDPILHLTYMNLNYLSNGDYAIVKQNTTERTSCRKLSRKENFYEPERVFYKGYPGASQGRPEGLNSDGQSFLMSQGSIVASILSNTCLLESQRSQSANWIYDRPEIILSTVDVLPGASGSALLNSDDEIIGVINSVFSLRVNIYQQYCRGSAVAVSVRHILQHMEEVSLPSEDFLSCD